MQNDNVLEKSFLGVGWDPCVPETKQKFLIELSLELLRTISRNSLAVEQGNYLTKGRSKVFICATFEVRVGRFYPTLPVDG